MGRLHDRPTARSSRAGRIRPSLSPVTIAPPDLPVPDAVVVLAAGRAIEPVWRNGIGGTTWRLVDGTTETYLKIGPRHWEFDVPAHVARLTWVGQYVAAPRVLATGELDSLLWFETAALPGWGAVSEHFAAGSPFAPPPAEMAEALGRALRTFHDAVPVAACPWTWSVADRIAARTLPRAEQLVQHPPVDAVVCHGDACNPNFMLDDDLRCTGYVDLGQLGVADRWADIASATLSLGWNLGPDLTDSFLDGYGLALDQERLTYYRRLWGAEEEAFAVTDGAADIPLSTRKAESLGCTQST